MEGFICSQKVQSIVAAMSTCRSADADLKATFRGQSKGWKSRDNARSLPGLLDSVRICEILEEHELYSARRASSTLCTVLFSLLQDIPLNTTYLASTGAGNCCRTAILHLLYRWPSIRDACSINPNGHLEGGI
jgi:hypothetical protein